MAQKVLLVVRMRTVGDEVKAALAIPGLELVTATTLAEVREAFATDEIAQVFMGAGIELEERLAIVRAIFEASDQTTVHMKDRASGPHGYLPFVQAILEHLPESTPERR